ncbi:CPBP family intramembrane metalloprotease [soil metagenome]
MTHTRTTTTTGEAVAIMAICFGLSIAASLNAVASGFPVSGTEFTDAAMLWLLVMELLLGGIAALVLHRRGFAVPTLMPTPTLIGCAWGFALFCVGSVAAGSLMAAFASGQAPQPIDQMTRTANLSLPVIVMVSIVNGAFEEIFLLGFLMRGLRGYGLSVALGVMLLVRILYHLYQGPIGTMGVLGVGFVFGAYFIRFGKLWPPVFAHVLFDLLALTR